MSAINYRKMIAEERANMAKKSSGRTSNDRANGENVAISSDETLVGLKPPPSERSSPLVTQGNNELTVKLAISPNITASGNKVGNVDNIFYFPNVVDTHTEEYLLKNVAESGLTGSWKQLKTRRLQCWGVMPGPLNNNLENFEFESTESKLKHIPEWLNTIASELVAVGVFPDHQHPNNVLINEYEANEGILHHCDGPKYCDRVAIISLGTDCVMSFRKQLKPEEIGQAFAGDLFSVMLRARSMLVFERSAYSSYMHGISAANEHIIGENGECINSHLAGVTFGEKISKGVRTSLTFRKVL